MKKTLIVIAGPTACGKTDISIEIAKKLNGEIISADSMQVYKLMDIGTAKPTKEEMQAIPHHLIDEIYPNEEYNAMVFQKMAKEYIQKIHEKGKIPILVGGTGFYINALVYDNNFMSTNEGGDTRSVLYSEAELHGKEYVFQKLVEVDPEYAKTIHFNNLKRVIRAIEYFWQTGEKMSEHNKRAKEKTSPYNTIFIVLNMDREKLYNRINQRVNKMMSMGLLEEVKSLLNSGYSPSLVSMQGLGYKEFMPYFNHDIYLDEAVETLKKKTRNFAKRQLTWFRGQNEGHWIDITNKSQENVLNEILDIINNKME